MHRRGGADDLVRHQETLPLATRAVEVQRGEHRFPFVCFRKRTPWARITSRLGVALRRDADLAPARLGRKKYQSTTLLIIDEVGFEPMNPKEVSLFFRIVSHRYRRGSILITTDKGSKDWPETRCSQRPSSTGCSTTATCSMSKAVATGFETSNALSPSAADPPRAADWGSSQEGGEPQRGCRNVS